MAPPRGPSPRDDARRRGVETPSRRRDRDADAPWLDEAEYDEDEGDAHTLIGRRMLFGLLFALGVLVIGVVVGIGLVSKRDSSPIDVPAVGEEVPVLRAPGPWKLPPTGPDVDGVPVEGQGQVLFGTGDGQETEAAIALDALPEDPLPRPGADALPAVDEALEAETLPAPRPQAAKPAAPADPAAPKPAATRPPTPKVIEAPEPAASPGGGQLVQLGAFSSEARARAAFKSLSGRYAYLAGMEPLIVPVTADGKTLYRLRSAAGSPALARDICGRLRVAGEACTVVD